MAEVCSRLSEEARMAPDTTFSIVVPTFRRPDALREALAAILRVVYPPEHYEVIVIDDDADELTEDIVGRFRGRGVEITLQGQRHRGAAAARNEGARLAAGDVVLFCDDDILIEPPHLRLHASARERHEDALIGGAWDFSPGVMAALSRSPFGRYRIALERRFQEDALNRALDGESGCRRVPMLCSSNLALRRERFWEIGGFDEDFPVAGAEDQDLSIRARAAGALLLLDTRIRCLHNDNRLTLREYCLREERNAETMPFLARKYPSELAEVPYVRENRPIRADDPHPLVLKKLVKMLLAHRVILAALHGGVRLLEAAHAPEQLLRRFYKTLLGIHLFRGFRRSWGP